MKMSGFYSKEELEAMHFKSLGTEEWSVCAGVPAKKIKNRYRDVARLYEQVKQEL